MRNLNNINHWIAELRDIAFECNFENVCGKLTMDIIRAIFSKSDYEQDFKDGMTPQESIDFTIEGWNVDNLDPL